MKMSQMRAWIYPAPCAGVYPAIPVISIQSEIYKQKQLPQLFHWIEWKCTRTNLMKWIWSIFQCFNEENGSKRKKVSTIVHNQYRSNWPTKLNSHNLLNRLVRFCFVLTFSISVCCVFEYIWKNDGKKLNQTKPFIQVVCGT